MILCVGDSVKLGHLREALHSRTARLEKWKIA